jgi:hypothetical protein
MGNLTMAGENLRSILNSSGLSLRGDETVQRVQVELRGSAASDQCLQRLQACGLRVDETIGNKVFGSVKGKDRKALQALDEVAGVERVVTLKPHQQAPDEEG